jgi:uncharacterized delta-60 repeat protein
VRYKKDGSPDTGFGTDGKVTTPLGAQALAIQSDGKIVVAGNSFNGTKYGFGLARYNADGSPDTGFGTGGNAIPTIVGQGDQVSSVAIQSDGKIVVAGYSNVDLTIYAYTDFALVRYNADGSLDTGFGTGGKVTTGIEVDDVATSVAIQPDGKIVAAGYTFNGTNYDFALVRYNTDGSLDTGFGTGGKVTTPIGPDSGNLIIVAASGKRVKTTTTFGSNDYAAIASNGSTKVKSIVIINDGDVVTTFGSNDYANSMAIQPDGKIVLAGCALSTVFALARYNTDGSLDTGFGTGGKVTTAIGPGNDDHGESVAIQSDGKIIVAGYSYNGSNFDFGLARYNTDCSLDAGFGTGGKVTTAIGPGNDYAVGVAIQPDGRIVVAGPSDNGTTGTIAIVRYWQ